MTVTRHLCMTKDIGTNGNLFGGNMMAWLDEAAAIFAQINASHDIATLKVSEILFKKPIKIKDLVEIHCDLTNKGDSSITIKTKAIVNKGIVCSCIFVFVNVEDGKPIYNTLR